MIRNEPESCVVKSRHHAIQFCKAVHAIVVAPDHYHRSAVAWLDLVMFHTGVAHENEHTGFKIEIANGLCMLPLELLGRHEVTLKDAGMNSG
jgi:hypothetical protein